MGTVLVDEIVANGWIPEIALRAAIRQQLRNWATRWQNVSPESRRVHNQQLIEKLSQSPAAVATDFANRQHYELSPEMYEYILGPQMKYSSSLWEPGSNLAEAELRMLNSYIQRAQIQNGQSILDLGCGWGASCLYFAESFPNSQITALTNSVSQKHWIQSRAHSRQLKNLKVIKADLSHWQSQNRYDRIIAIEVLEHMRNFEEIFSRIAQWLKPEGQFFAHAFVDRDMPELYDDDDWMSRHFFTGGIMPSEHLFYYFNKDLRIHQHWCLSGLHYARTCRAWLHNLQKNERNIIQFLRSAYGRGSSMRWLQFWRTFFISCEELFSYENGRKWYVCHYLMRKN